MPWIEFFEFFDSMPYARLYPVYCPARLITDISPLFLLFHRIISRPIFFSQIASSAKSTTAITALYCAFVLANVALKISVVAENNRCSWAGNNLTRNFSRKVRDTSLALYEMRENVTDLTEKLDMAKQEHEDCHAREYTKARYTNFVNLNFHILVSFARAMYSKAASYFLRFPFRFEM